MTLRFALYTPPPLSGLPLLAAAVDGAGELLLARTVRGHEDGLATLDEMRTLLMVRDQPPPGGANDG